MKKILLTLALAGAAATSQAQLAIDGVLAGSEGIQFDLHWGPVETSDEFQYVRIENLAYRGFRAAVHELSVNFGKHVEVFFTSTLSGGFSAMEFALTATRLFADATIAGNPTGPRVMALEEVGLRPFQLNSITPDPTDPYAARFSFDTLPNNFVASSDPAPLGLPEAGDWFPWIVGAALVAATGRVRR